MAEKKRMRAAPAAPAASRPAARGSKSSHRGGTTRPETRTISHDAQRRADRQDETQEKKQQQGKQQRSSGKSQQSVEPTAMREPAPPFAPQHQQHPGLQAELEPQPRSEGQAYKPAGKLEGKTALITGGDSGIGRAVAIFYAKEGADVAIVYLEEEQEDAEQTRDAVEQEGRRCVLIPGDVTDADFCRRAVEQVVHELGQIDILVNNAAFQQHQKSLEDISEQQWEHTFRTNIFGYFHMAKAALPHLGEGSTIINTGSITGLQGSKELIDYSSTKGAIHAFTKSLAQNLLKKKIRVNCVAPGPVWTPLNVVDNPPEKAAKFGTDVPMKRPAQPEEIAPAYVYFASDADSSYVTGEVLTLLGGETTAG